MAHLVQPPKHAGEAGGEHNLEGIKRTVPGEGREAVLGELVPQHHHHGAAHGLLPRLLGRVCRKRPHVAGLETTTHTDPRPAEEDETSEGDDALPSEKVLYHRAHRWLARGHNSTLTAGGAPKNNVALSGAGKEEDRLDVGCVKVLGNKLCPSCRAFGLTNADIIHDAQCAAQALKARRAVAANVAKKKTFQSVIVDNKVEVARAAGKVKAMAARDGIGFCPNFNQTALPCKTSARCRYAPCVNFEALLHTAFKDTVYERMPSAVRLGTSRGRRAERRGGRGRGGGGGGEVKSNKKDWASGRSRSRPLPLRRRPTPRV